MFGIQYPAIMLDWKRLITKPVIKSLRYIGCCIISLLPPPKEAVICLFDINSKTYCCCVNKHVFAFEFLFILWLKPTHTRNKQYINGCYCANPQKCI